MPQLSSTLGRVSYLTLVLGLALGPALVPALDLAAQSRGGELPLNVGPKDIPRLLKATAHVRELSEEALRAMVPQQSGLQYVDCPNCTAGNQERQLSWDPAEPNKVTCDYCGHGYPSEKYPMSESLTVHNPRGELVSFPYWENAEGYRHFFQARRDDEVRKYLASRTSDLAKLYVATQDKAHARRAAVILDQFAQVFPGWCYHFDYPFRQKEIYDGDVSPDQFLAGYRTARWTWWAYSDIPQPLVEAFDWVRDSGALEELSQELGVDVAKRIEQDLFRNAAEQVLANPEPLTNMSPNAWISLIKLGRVLGEPHYVHEPVRRLKALLESKFLYDGMWYEGAPSYARMTVGGLQGVLDVLEGYSDPAGYVDPQDGSRFEQLDATQISPILSRARTTLEQMVLPNGRLVPVHDTWAENRLNRGTEATKPYLIPALGHACLGGGSGANQTQFHLTWSGGYGHSHADNLSLLLFAQGREMLSDLGYSHTAYRSWTLATAAHNTVVIDGQNQSMGGVQSPSDGRLLLCELQDPQVQVVSADGSRAYEGLAKTYRRTLVVVDAGQGQRYAVDVFDVLGGQTHDYFLHGDADQPTSLATTLPLAPLATLLPPGFDWEPTRNEGETSRISAPHYAYGFLRKLRSATVAGGDTLSLDFQDGQGTGPGLRVSLIPEADSQLIIGENPSIRGADEDDTQLENFHRPFMILRRNAAGGRSRFVSVLQPYASTPFLKSVERIPTEGEALVLRVVSGERTDYIVVDAQGAVSLPSDSAATNYTFAATSAAIKISKLAEGRLLAPPAVGVLSLDAAGAVRTHVAGAGSWSRGAELQTTGSLHTAQLRAVDGQTLVVDAAKDVPLPPAGAVLRLLTADGWVYPFTLAAAQAAGESLRLEVVESPGIAWDPAAGQWQQISYPPRKHRGELRIEWSVRQ